MREVKSGATGCVARSQESGYFDRLPTHMGGVPKAQGLRIANRSDARCPRPPVLNWISNKKKPPTGSPKAAHEGRVCVPTQRALASWPTCVAASRRTAALSPCHHSAP